MSKVAVVILNYNGEKLLPQFLPSVIANSNDASIYVIDNASNDRSVAILKKDFPAVRLVVLDHNYGFCGGYNRGLQQINTPYYVLLNSDVEVTPGWLAPMLNLAEADPTVAAVQPKILAYNNKRKFEYAGAAGGFIDTLGYPFCRGRILDYTEEDRQQYNDTRQVFWGSGACLFIRSSVYHQFGGLDEDLFAHMEEIDLCWKINRAKLRVMYCGDSTVFHLGAGTLGYESPRKTYLNFRNGLTLIFKHLATGELYYKFPLRLALDWVAAVWFLLQGKVSNMAAVLRAHVDFLKNITRDKRKRKQIRSQFPTYSKTGIYKGLVIVEYYLKGKKSIDV